LKTAFNRQLIGQIVQDDNEVQYRSFVTRRNWFNSQLMGVSAMEATKICLVCGYNGLEVPPYEEGCPSYERCDCCGNIPGLSDYSESFQQLRTNWAKQGAIWHIQGKQPEHWTALHQLQNLRQARADIPSYLRWINGKNFTTYSPRLISGILNAPKRKNRRK
ncbi:MAG: hypothetical protein AAF570_24400, partial [Bacteroidota bacterium]